MQLGKSVVLIELFDGLELSLTQQTSHLNRVAERITVVRGPSFSDFDLALLTGRQRFGYDGVDIFLDVVPFRDIGSGLNKETRV